MNFTRFLNLRLVVILIVLLLIATLSTADDTVGTLWLSEVMDQYHESYIIYRDGSCAGNNFNSRGKMGNLEIAMAHDWQINPHSGIDCVRAFVEPNGTNTFAGFYFLNGTLEGEERTPSINWGDTPNAGVDLTGATKLTFWAKGDQGGEQVQFFCFGIGRDPDTGQPIKDYPGSSTKISLETVTLSTTWTKYTISLVGHDLSYVLGAFGWTVEKKSWETNPTVFYLDDIEFNLPRLDQPRFLVSYKAIQSINAFDTVLRNMSYTYDNCMTLLSFIAVGNQQRAKLIADALVYAQNNDRYYTDGRIRNAYQAGELYLPPGWIPNGKVNTIRMPGFWDSNYYNWFEDQFSISTDSGNVAWTMIALLSYYNYYGGNEYIEAAIKLGDWMDATMKDTRGAGGYMGSYEGWEPNAVIRTYKSTEHNLDLYVVFKRLYNITGESKWNTRAQHARTFTLAMWDDVDGKFWAGTEEDGVTLATDVIPTDAQPWTLLAFLDLDSNYWRGLTFNENNSQYPGSWGYDFNCNMAPWDTTHPDGIWYEGTGQMATAYMFIGENATASNVLNEIVRGRASSGAMYAVGPEGVESLSTGFWLQDGEWRYYRREHVGATGWAVMAETRKNAFWMGTDYGEFWSGDGGTTPPGNVTSSTAVAGDAQISLSWINPDNSDFVGVLIRRKTSGYPTDQTDGILVYNAIGTSYIDTNIINGVTYYYKVFSYDGVPNYASGLSASATPVSNDTTPPGNVINFNATASDTRITLSWINPDDSDLQGIKILRKTSSYPTSPTDGTVVFDSTATSYTDAGLTNGTAYYYTAFSYDEVPNYASGSIASAAPTSLQNKYVIYSETTPPTETYEFDIDGHLYVWKGLDIEDSASPYEGCEAWSLNINYYSWWGMGITYGPGPRFGLTGKDLMDYARGSLNVALKTSSNEYFKIGIKNGFRESWINGTDLDFVRDGKWHIVQVPLFKLVNSYFHDFSNVNQLVMFAGEGDPPGSTFNIEMDNIYYDSTPVVVNGTASMLWPIPYTTLPNSSTTFEWTESTTTTEYKISVATTQALLESNPDIYNESQGTNTSANVCVFATGKKIYLRLWSKIEGDWTYKDYTYTAHFGAAEITSPTPGSTFTDKNITFEWTVGNEVTEYKIGIANTQALLESDPDIYYESQGTNRSVNLYIAPYGGKRYLRLWSKIRGDWYYRDYTYTALLGAANITKPNTDNIMLAILSNVKFEWDSGIDAAEYKLSIATTKELLESNPDVYDSSVGLNRSIEVSGIPSCGDLQLRLWSKIGGVWCYKDYTYVSHNVGPDNTTEVSFGSREKKSIGIRGDIDAFKFTGTAGDKIFIGFARKRGTRSALDIQLQLYDENANQIAREVADPGYGNEITITLPDDGQYYILISEREYRTTGYYYLTLQRLNNPGGVTATEYGVTKTGSVYVNGDIDTYSFTGTAGDKVWIRFAKTDTDNGFLDIQFRLYDKNGNKIAREVADPGYRNEITVTLPDDGQYTIIINERDYDRTGGYWFALQRLNNPGGSTTVNYGNTNSGSVLAKDEVDVYDFSGEAGDKVLIRVARTIDSSARFDIQFRLYDKNGNLILEGRADPGNEQTITLPDNGQYSIFINEEDYDHIGRYSFVLQRLNNPGAITPATFGGTYYGSISTSADMNTHGFTGEAGDKVLFALARSDSSSHHFEIQIRLYDENGNKIAEEMADGTKEITITLSDDGQYFFLVNGQFFDRTGSYRFTLQRTNNPGALTTIAYGNTRTGSISGNPDIDAYGFTGNADDKISIPFQKTSGTRSFEVKLRLYDEDGTFITEAIAHRVSGELTATLPDNGQYCIFVSEQDYDETGNYKFTLTSDNESVL